jgi:hypothetical protein
MLESNETSQPNNSGNEAMATAGTSAQGSEPQGYEVIPPNKEYDDGAVIKRMINNQKDFALFINSNNGIQYKDLPGYARPANFAAIYQQVNKTEMLADLIYTHKEHEGLLLKTKVNIAEAFSLVLVNNESLADAKKDLQSIVLKMKGDAVDYARKPYILTAFFTTIAVVLSFVLGWLFKDCLIEWLHTEQAFNILLASFCGGIGAFISCFIRFRKYTGSIFSSILMHRLDGFFRIAYGTVAGFAAALAVKANVIGGFMGGSFVALLFISLIAGASEYFIPSLVGKMGDALLDTAETGNANQPANPQPGGGENNDADNPGQGDRT